MSKTRIQQLIEEGRVSIAERDDGTKVVILVSPIDTHLEADEQAVGGVTYMGEAGESIIHIFDPAPVFDFNLARRIRDRYLQGTPLSDSEGKLAASVYRVKQLLGEEGTEGPKSTQELIEMVDEGNLFALVALELKGALFSIHSLRPGWTFEGWKQAKQAIYERFSPTRERKEALKLVRELATRLADKGIDPHHTLRDGIPAIAKVAKNIEELRGMLLVSYTKAMSDDIEPPSVGHVEPVEELEELKRLKDIVNETIARLKRSMDLVVEAVTVQREARPELGAGAGEALDEEAWRAVFAATKSLISSAESIVVNPNATRLELERAQRGLLEELENFQSFVIADPMILTAQINAGETTFTDETSAYPAIFDGRRFNEEQDDLRTAVDSFCEDNRLNDFPANVVPVVLVNIPLSEGERIEELKKYFGNRAVIININDSLDTETYRYFENFFETYPDGTIFDDSDRYDLETLRKHLDKA